MYMEIKLEKPIWIISDVHGDFDKLMELIDKIPDKNPTLCFVGDLVDRGPKSRDVVKFVKDNNHYCVFSNHEMIMILGYAGAFIDYTYWMGMGGVKTAKSYLNDSFKDHEIESRSKDVYKALKSNKELLEHIEWFKTLPTIINFELKGEKPLYVSHSGFDIDNIDKIDEQEVIWNKKGYYPVSENGVNIYGHIVTSKDRAFRSKSHIGIDTGGYKKRNENTGVGYLTAIKYPTLERVFA